MGHLPEPVECNLTDAGCDCELMAEYERLEAQPKCKALIRKEQIRLLCKHRTKLLDELHTNQRKLDCLDHLLFQLKEAEDE